MVLKKFHDPGQGSMQVAGFMSGSGTNLRKILEHQDRLKKKKGKSPYEVAVIFSDDIRGNAPQIGKDYDIPVVIRDIRAYYKKRDRPRRDMGVREEYDAETLKVLRPFEVHSAAFAGYMSVASKVLVGGMLAINVHPADLSIKVSGERKYRGDHAVADAIRDGEKSVSATTHIVEAEVDEGGILVVSKMVDVLIEDGLSIGKDLDAIASANQDRLKEAGDWVIFPVTLQMIAEGRFEYDESNVIHFDGKAVPDGIRYGEFEIGT